MAWPPVYPFGNAVSPEAMANLDQMFDQVAAMIEIPCSASGTNAISLLPLANCPALPAYKELGGYRFRAAASSTGAVTAQFNGLGFLPAYHDDGVTQVNISDIIIGKEYVLRFSQSLNAGGGGFFLESPAAPTVTAPWYTPGGRLTIQAAVPVMLSNQVAQQIIYYAPYQHQFLPNYNGSNVQMYNFCAALSDQGGLQLNMGGAANFTSLTNFDIYASLLGGASLKLVAIPWTNNTTRATALTVFGGMLTNAGTATVQTGPNTSASMTVNQGTFLGTIRTGGGNGASNWIFGGAASGGVAAEFDVSNYYNQAEIITQVQDTGGSYTYTSSTVRQARASGSMQVLFVQTSPERGVLATYSCPIGLVVAAGFATIGMGLDTTTAFLKPTGWSETNSNGSSDFVQAVSTMVLGVTGFHVLSANEAGDNVNANTFNSSGVFGNSLNVRLWL